MYQITKYALSPQQSKDGVWRNRLIGQTLQLGPQLRELMPQLLTQDARAAPRDSEDCLQKLLAVELARRGFLIRQDEAVREEETLLGLGLTRLPRYGFYHVPTAWAHALPEDAQLAFVGVPSDLGAAKSGARSGPELLRERSLSFAFRGGQSGSVYSLQSAQSPLKTRKVFDVGDVCLERRGIDDWLLALQKTIAKFPRSCVPFTLGGDHTFSLGAIAGLYEQGKRDFAVLHFDSHLDIQAWGHFADGKPVALDEPIHSNFMSHVKARFPDLQIHQFGVRNYQSFPPDLEGQVQSYVQSVARQVSDLELLLGGNGRILADVPPGKEVYLSIDVDCLSKAWVSQTGYPAALGIQFPDLLKILREIFAKYRVIGVDLMEFGGNGSREVLAQEAELLNYLILQILEGVRSA